VVYSLPKEQIKRTDTIMFKKVIKAGTIVMAFLCLPLANAAIIDGASNTLLTVTYTQGPIADGPLSFGLVALPTEVIAKFVLDPTSLPPPTPGGPIPIPFHSPTFFATSTKWYPPRSPLAMVLGQPAI